MILAVGLVLLFSLLAVGGAWYYFRRFAVKRPPIGVFNLADVGLLMCSILLIPFLYLFLPIWLLSGLLALGALGVLIIVFEPVLKTRQLVWGGAIMLGLLDVAALRLYGANSISFAAVNNVVQGLVVMGIANLWAQSGMKARDLAILAGALVLYDFVFTFLLSLMGDLFTAMAGLPFAPLVAWPLDADHGVAIGIGDLILAAVFPLVMRKSYGVRAGRWALLSLTLGLALIFVLALSGLLPKIFPVMTIMGPLMVLQAVGWQHRRGAERTVFQYLQDEPLRG